MRQAAEVAALACSLALTVQPVHAAGPKPASPAATPKLVFERYIDRTEGAFLVLVPKGWQTDGGMVRVNPLTAVGGAGQSIEAKIDFTIRRDPAGKVMLRYLPKINYAEPSPYNAMLGGNWNGMPVVARQTARDFLLRLLFPGLHPQASDVKEVEVTPRPDIAAAVRALPAGQALTAQGIPYSVDAAVVTVSYNEAGTRFRETLFVAVDGFSVMGVALWSNPFTIVARAPEAEFAAYGPVAKVIMNSFALNPRWLSAEMQGQIQRGRIVQDTLAELARIDQEIAENRSRTMSQINEQQYLTLTAQEKYRNPHSGEVELGSNDWKHRWVNTAGETIYTDDPNWNPNMDPDLRVSGFKRSAPVQP